MPKLITMHVIIHNAIIVNEDNKADEIIRDKPLSNFRPARKLI